MLVMAVLFDLALERKLLAAPQIEDLLVGYESFVVRFEFEQASIEVPPEFLDSSAAQRRVRRLMRLSIDLDGDSGRHACSLLGPFLYIISTQIADSDASAPFSGALGESGRSSAPGDLTQGPTDVDIRTGTGSLLDTFTSQRHSARCWTRYKEERWRVEGPWGPAPMRATPSLLLAPGGDLMSSPMPSDDPNAMSSTSQTAENDARLTEAAQQHIEDMRRFLELQEVTEENLALLISI